MRPLALILFTVLAACSAPRAGVTLDRQGQVQTSAAGQMGPVTVGVGNQGGYVGTKLGWLTIGAGF